MKINFNAVKSMFSFFAANMPKFDDATIMSRFMKGIFWSLSSSVLVRILALISSVIIARLLGKEGFGELGTIQNTIAMFNVFAVFGMGSTATKHVAQFRTADPIRAGHVIALSSIVTMVTGIVASITLGLLAPWLATYSLAAPQLTNLLRISAILLFFSSINAAQTGALSGFEAFKVVAKINFIVGILSFPVMIAAVVSNGLYGAVWALVVNIIINCLVNNYAIRRLIKEYKIDVSFSGCLSEKSILFNYSIPSVLGGLIVMPVNWICMAILVNQPNGYAEMGVYNAACQWRSAILFVPGAVGAIVLPMLSNMISTNGKKSTLNFIKSNLILNGVVAFTLALIISFFSKYIMGVYGKEFIDGWPVLILVSVSAILMSLTSVISNTLASFGNMWFIFLFDLLWGIALISISYYLIPMYGALGFAISFAVAYLLHAFWQSLYLKYYLRGST